MKKNMKKIFAGLIRLFGKKVKGGVKASATAGLTEKVNRFHTWMLAFTVLRVLPVCA